MPMTAVIGATTLGGAAISANAANRAAQAQSRAFQQAQQQMLPFSMPGQGAAARLAMLYGIDPATGQPNGQPFNQAALDDFTRSPDYQFARQQGLQGVQNTMAGQGLLRSGNTLRGLTDYASGLATQTFGNYRGALQQLAQLGAGAAGNIGQAMIGQGTANASGIVGAANAYSGALGSMGNYFMLQNLLRPGQSAYTPPGNPGGGGINFGAAAPFSNFNPGGFSSVLPGGVGAVPY